MTISEDAGRAAIVAEARSWIGTPYHHGGRVKGVGCDCGTLIAGVYERTGIIAPGEIDPYPPDWHQHRTDERYLGIILGHGHEIPAGAKKPGDVAMWKFGLTRSHGAIIVDWPLVVHATISERIVWLCDISKDVRYNGQAPQFYSFW